MTTRPFSAAAGMLILAFIGACSATNSRPPSSDSRNEEVLKNCDAAKIEVPGLAFETAFDVRYRIDEGEHGFSVPAPDYSRAVRQSRSVELRRAADIALGDHEILRLPLVFKSARPNPLSPRPLGTPSLDTVGHGGPRNEVEPEEYRLMLRYLPVRSPDSSVRTACIAWSGKFRLEQRTRLVVEDQLVGGRPDVRPEDPQSWNMNAHVRNNPINATDPDGRKGLPATAGDRGGIRVMPGTATPRAFECKPFGRTEFTMSNPAAFSFHSFALPGGAGGPSDPKNADAVNVALPWDSRGKDGAAASWTPLSSTDPNQVGDRVLYCTDGSSPSSRSGLVTEAAPISGPRRGAEQLSAPSSIECSILKNGMAGPEVVVTVTNHGPRDLTATIGIDALKPGRQLEECSAMLEAVHVQAGASASRTMALRSLRFTDRQGADTPAQGVAESLLKGELELRAWICDTRVLDADHLRSSCLIFSKRISVTLGG